MVSDDYKFTIPLKVRLETRNDRQLNDVSGFILDHLDQLTTFLRDTHRFNHIDTDEKKS